MKKLLSILAISGVIGMSSSTVISCGETTKVTFPDSFTLKDAKTADVNTGTKLYDYVRTAISDQVKKADGTTKVYADKGAVKDDTNFGIAIREEGKPDSLPLADTDDTAIVAGTYMVALNANADDMYVNAFSKNSIKLVVSDKAVTTQNLPTVADYTSKVVVAGSQVSALADEFRNALVKSTDPAVTAEQVKNDDKITIDITLEGKPVKEDADLVASKEYTFSVTVAAGDAYFNEVTTAQVTKVTSADK